MFGNISWDTFFVSIAGATILYYAVVGLIYFRPELQAIFSGKRPTATSIPGRDSQLSDNGNINHSGELSKAANNDAVLDLDRLETIINEIRYEIIPKAGSHPTKEKLSVLFRNYLSGLKGNLPLPYKNSISQLMVREAAAQCGVAFNEEEITQLW